MASAEFSKFAGILSVALSQHHFLEKDHQAGFPETARQCSSGIYRPAPAGNAQSPVQTDDRHAR